MKFTDLEYGDELTIDDAAYGIMKVLKSGEDFVFTEINTKDYGHTTREKINEKYKRIYPDFAEYIELLPKNRMVTRWNHSGGWIDGLTLVARKIADTKINRKLYKGKIKREEKGYIIVAMS